MYPILLSLGPLKIYSFGVFLVLAVIVGSFVVWREGRKTKLNEESLVDLILFTMFFGLIGARVSYLALHFNSFGWNPFSWLLFTHFPGLTFIGGLIGGIWGIWIFTKKNNWSFWQTGDLLVLGVSLGEAIGRVGAFLSGSAYGAVTNLPWGVSMVGLLGKRHPSQLYESLAALVIFLVLLKLRNLVEVKKLAPGFLLLTYFLLYGLMRFFLEIARGDSVYFMGWRVVQLEALLFIALAFFLLYRRLGRSVKGDLFACKKRASASLFACKKRASASLFLIFQKLRRKQHV